MRRARAVCSQYRRRNGVALRFQVSTNKVEPPESNRAISLLSKDDWRATLADEGIPVRPEVTRVVKPLPLACIAETGARAAPCPDRAVVGPSGGAQGVAPESAAAEEVTLGVPHKVGCSHVFDASFIHIPRGYFARRDGLPEHLGLERVDLVVPGRQRARGSGGTAGPQFIVQP